MNKLYKKEGIKFPSSFFVLEKIKEKRIDFYVYSLFFYLHNTRNHKTNCWRNNTNIKD